MDLNIDDILADLDRDTTAVDSRSQGGILGSDDLKNDNLSSTILNSSLRSDIGNAGGKGFTAVDRISTPSRISPVDDFSQLLIHWKNERCAPELLPYPHLLMERMLLRIQDQMERLEMMSMNFFDENDDDSRNRNNNSGDTFRNPGNAPANNNNMLPLLCMEAELERVKFIIRSYIRCRLSKIDKYSLFLSQNSMIDEEIGENRIEQIMSESEIEYHQKHFSLMLNLMNESVLKYLPAELQTINDTEGSVSMIDEPDWNKFVFINVKGPMDSDYSSDPLLTKDEYGKYYYSVTIPELNEDVELTIGSIYVMRYNVIKGLLQDGKVELI